MTDEQIVAFLRDRIPGLIAVYRFGSTAGGEPHSGSDVDLAILAAEPMDPVRRFQVQEDLARLVRRDVDLIDLRRASTVMRMQVIGPGRLLGSFDDAAQGAFEDQAYSAYARLNEERREILEQVAREGRVHAR